MNRLALDLLVLYPNNRERAFGELGDMVAAISPPVQAGLIASYARRAGLRVAILDAEVDNLSATINYLYTEDNEVEATYPDNFTDQSGGTIWHSGDNITK